MAEHATEHAADSATSWDQRVTWVYGFHLKKKRMMEIARENKLPLVLDEPRGALITMDGVRKYIWQTKKGGNGFEMSWTPVVHRGKHTAIISFLECFDKKSLEGLEVTNDQIEIIRERMMLPKGRQPKWYRVDADEDEGEVTSEDEEIEGWKKPKSTAH